MDVLVFTMALIVGTPPPRERNVDLELRATSGVDSNVVQSSRSRGWSFSSVTEADGSAFFLVGEDVAGIEGDLVLDLGEGADRAHRLAFQVEGTWTSLVWGQARIRALGKGSSRDPHLRLSLSFGYGTGLRLDAERTQPPRSPPPVHEDQDEDSHEDEDPDEYHELDEDDRSDGLAAGALEDDATAGALAFLSPFHDLWLDADLRLQPRRSTRLRVKSRLRRTFRSRDPGDHRSPHFTEMGVELEGEERLFRWLRLELSYGLRARIFDQLTDGRGGTRIRMTHRSRLGLQGRAGRLRLEGGYGLSIRDSNRAGRSRLRHELDGALGLRLDDGFTLVVEVLLGAEERFGRPERNWTRFRSLAGVAIEL